MAESIASVCYRWHDRRGSPVGAAVERHDHACCQLELMTQGHATFLADRDHDLGPGDALLLPPGCPHAIRYRSACRYTSIKFDYDGPGLGRAAIPLPATPLRRALEAAITTCLVDPHAEPEAGLRLAVEHCLAALIAAVRPPSPPAAGGDPLLVEIGEILRKRAGRPIGVADLAAHLGLSPSRLSARIRAATGEGAKRLIDRSRGEQAARLLTYADQDIATIADSLGFPDPFTFSRFFHRVMGRSPRAWRREAARSG